MSCFFGLFALNRLNFGLVSRLWLLTFGHSVALNYGLLARLGYQHLRHFGGLYFAALGLGFYRFNFGLNFDFISPMWAKFFGLFLFTAKGGRGFFSFLFCSASQGNFGAFFRTLSDYILIFRSVIFWLLFGSVSVGRFWFLKDGF
jgi:hypothetical protein